MYKTLHLFYIHQHHTSQIIHKENREKNIFIDNQIQHKIGLISSQVIDRRLLQKVSLCP